MSFSVVFRRIAKREFDDAISWYQDRREGLGREFSVAVEQQLGRIALSPNEFACVIGTIPLLFRYFKDHWRNPVNHFRSKYDEPQALSAINHVRDFMQHIATKLKEET